MPLIDDLREPVSEEEVTRRRALAAIGGGALAVAGLGTLITGVRYMRPNVLFEPATRFALGRADDVPVGGVLDLPKRKLFLVRAESGFYAMSSVCTHLGCMVRHQKDPGASEAFFCPCHGSRFDVEGEVLGGPAPRPLDRVRLEIDGGKLVVDVSEPVPHGTVTAS
jgi:nitrite reductase/ring-hydroxylating ferredoxin subunit